MRLQGFGVLALILALVAGACTAEQQPQETGTETATAPAPTVTETITVTPSPSPQLTEEEDLALQVLEAEFAEAWRGISDEVLALFQEMQKTSLEDLKEDLLQAAENLGAIAGDFASAAPPPEVIHQEVLAFKEALGSFAVMLRDASNCDRSNTCAEVRDALVDFWVELVTAWNALQEGFQEAYNPRRSTSN